MAVPDADADEGGFGIGSGMIESTRDNTGGALDVNTGALLGLL